MCGITGTVGIIEKGNRKKMVQSLSHRGPDGEGEYETSDEYIWLAHKRLAIIDPDKGIQPLSNEDESVWITFNGCIYNYLELAQTLRQKGHKFRTNCDTEVIVHAYEEYGPDCLNHFIGMFAFVIWDQKKEQIFCARDRIGIKPFYFWITGEHFIFGSEIKCLFESGMIQPSIDYRSLAEYIHFQCTLGNKTLFEGIKKLEPGHYMLLKTGVRPFKPVIKQYWDVKFDINYEATEEFFVDRLKLLLDDAVKIRLRSDVTLGAHLSGGLDSSTVASIAALLWQGDEPLHSFTGSFSEGATFDESGYARLVAEKSGLIFNLITPSALDFQNTIRDIIYYMDEPAAGPGVFPQYMVSKLASQHVKVVLGGQGGDEIFAGYARYLIGYLEESLKGAIEDNEDSARYVSTLSSLIPSLPMLKNYTPMLKKFWSSGLFDEQNKRYFHLMDRTEGDYRIYNPKLMAYRDEIEKEFTSIFFRSNAKSFLNRMLYFDIKVHLPALLHVEDRTSMAWGLESRIPLLDHRIIELIASIPPTIKFKEGQPKYIFKRAIQNTIPQEILERKDKMGFPVPLQKWFKDELKQFIHEQMTSPASKNDSIFNYEFFDDLIENEREFGRNVWGALCLHLWHSTFISK